jgi:hypothetical protein
VKDYESALHKKIPEQLVGNEETETKHLIHYASQYKMHQQLIQGLLETWSLTFLTFAHR